MELLKLTAEHEEVYFDFIKEWDESGETITPYAARPHGLTFQEWLQKTKELENDATCPPKVVPSQTCFLFDDKRIIGAVNIRYYLNEYLLNYGGHIGYGIRPTERKKGMHRLC